MKIYFVKGQLIKTQSVILEDNQFMSKYTYKQQILQYNCFNWWTYCNCLYVKWLLDMSQYNKLSNCQYSRFQVLAVYLYFGLFG